MTLKAEITGHLAEVANRIEQRAGQVPENVRDAQATLAGWGARARGFARRNPGAVLIGAFAIGFVLARAARHA